jgi:hypothetical protein
MVLWRPSTVTISAALTSSALSLIKMDPPMYLYSVMVVRFSAQGSGAGHSRVDAHKLEDPRRGEKGLDVEERCVKVENTRIEVVRGPPERLGDILQGREMGLFVLEYDAWAGSAHTHARTWPSCAHCHPSLLTHLSWSTIAWPSSYPASVKLWGENFSRAAS